MVARGIRAMVSKIQVVRAPWSLALGSRYLRDLIARFRRSPHAPTKVACHRLATCSALRIPNSRDAVRPFWPSVAIRNFKK